MSDRVLIVIPGDDPRQIADSPHLDRLASRGDVRLYRDRPESVDEQVRRVREADVLLNSRGHVKWMADSLCQLPRLKMIAMCSIGTDSIDLETARRQGIVVCNVPGRTATVVAEHALGMMFAAAKRLAFQTTELKAGRWTRADNLFLAGKMLGVVGTGAIGSEVLRLGRAIGMQTQAWTFRPTPERAVRLSVPYVSLDTLLATSDVVSLHVQLTPQSRGLIGGRELSLMKPGSLLINTARGPIVDHGALVAALQSGHLGGAAVDVFDVEPLPADDPILACEQVVLTPHSADHTPEGIDLLNAGAVDNILAFLDGRPENVVH